MNWRQIERWATIAIYASAGVGLAILLAEALLPPGSLAGLIASAAASNLIRLGEIGGGLLFAIALTALSVMGSKAWNCSASTRPMCSRRPNPRRRRMPSSSPLRNLTTASGT